MNPVEQHIFNQEEPFRSIMLYVRDIILKVLPMVEENYSYKTPFFNIQKKPMVYLNILKGTNFVDVAFVQGIVLEEKYPQLKNYNNRKQVRSLQLKSIEDLDEIMFTQLLKDATTHIENSDKAWFV